MSETQAWVKVAREEYRKGALSEREVLPEPVGQFRVWWEAVKTAAVVHPDQMVLSTATTDGRPSGRVVLLKAVDERGFVFVTNYESRKSAEMLANPWVALCFYWEELERQVRIEGKVEKVSAEVSAEYFSTRPRAAQVGAWASPQSKVLSGREELEASVAEAAARFPGVVPCPPNWGGWRVVPEVVEFWQGRESRLHDRVVYRRAGSAWRIERLAP